MDDGFERRALLLHLGTVLESIACVAKCGERFPKIAEAAKEKEELADFSFLQDLSDLSPGEYVQRAAGAYFLWPKLLLEDELNRAALANLVQNDLFAGNQVGWDKFVADLRKEVPWFGEGLGPVKQVIPSTSPIWPPNR